jgi:undecaprenyl-diphosphatase
MNKKKKNIIISACLIIAAIIFTILVKTIDVKTVGLQGTDLGFSTINKFVFKTLGENKFWYQISEWVGLIPIFMAACYGMTGVIQLKRRKSILKVDKEIIALGAFYVVVLAIYVLFEKVIINYRPILVDGVLEASYPSSTTLLVMCVMSTAIMQINERVKSVKIRKIIDYLIVVFIVFMVLGRTISGVHWISDIIGGALLSTGLVWM